MTRSPLATAKQWLAYSASTIRAAKVDQQHVRAYGQILYNLDFNLLAPVLADHAPTGVPPFQVESRDNYYSLLSEIDPQEPIKLTITEPTVLEVMDLLLHNDKNLAALQVRVDKLEQGLDKQLPTADSTSIEHELSDVLTRSRFPESRKTSRTLLELLRGKKLSGMGDWLDARSISSERRLYAKFTEIYAKEYRARSARDTRGEQDKVFHYKIDALNVCLTLATASNRPAESSFFVSATGINTNLCELQSKGFGRKPLVPVFVRNAMLIDGKSSKESILEDADGFVCHLIQMIGRSDSVTDRVLKQLADLKATFLDPLTGTQEEDRRAPAPPPASRSAPVSATEFRKGVDAERKTIREGAKEIAATIAQKAAYLERFQIFEDPIVKRMERELGVKLHQPAFE